MNDTLLSTVSTARSVATVVLELDGKLPTDLAAALDAYDAAEEYDLADSVDADLEALTVTASKVPGLIDKLTADVARREPRRQARAFVLDRLAHRVATALRSAGAELVDAMAPAFTAAADRFTAAHALLPPGCNADDLVRGGPDTVARFGEAADAAGTLSVLASARNSLAALGIGGRSDVDKGTRFARVRDRSVAITAAHVAATGPLGRWGALLELPGVEGLWWPSLAEHAAYVAELPEDSTRYRTTRTGGFITHENVTTAA